MFLSFLDEYKNTKVKALKEEDFSKKPTTSWIIRTFNEEKWLGRVLATLFMQSRLDFEVIIVDSGSTDATLDIIKHFPVRKLIQIEKKDFNYSYALNLGGKEARGQFLGILSGHSLPVSRNWYKLAMENFRDEKIAAVTGHYNSLPDGDLTEKLGDLYFDIKRLEKEEFCKWMTNTNAIIRKKLWQQYPFDERLAGCEDYDWASEMIARGFNVVKDPCFNVYHSHGGIGKATYEERVAGWDKATKEIDKKTRPSNSFSRLF